MMYKCPGESNQFERSDSYSTGYEVSADGQNFSICCQGLRHPLLMGQANQPSTNAGDWLAGKHL